MQLRQKIAQTPLKNPLEKTIENDRSAINGFCFVCDCKVCRILKMEKTIKYLLI